MLNTHAECHHAECRYAECPYDECRGAREIAVVQDLFNCLNHSINCHKLFTPASSKSFHAKVLKVKVGQSQRHKMNRLLMS